MSGEGRPRQAAAGTPRRAARTGEKVARIALLAATVTLSVGGAGRAEIRFAPAAERWGLEFRHHHGGSGRLYMVEANGSGVVLFDFDGDGDLDVLMIDGAPLPGYDGPPPGSRLLRNDGGSFVDVTGRAGLAVAAYGTGGVAGDVDGDGDLDLYMAAFGPNLLFDNRGDGSFREVGAERGVDDPAWGASAAFADVEGDGDLDLYVTNYVDFTLDDNKPCGDQKRQLRGYCGPDVYNGLPDRFFRNRGDGLFDDDTAAAGFAGARGAGLGACFGDLDDDGRVDLYVANDLMPNYLFRNRGDGSFEDVSLLSGTAFGDRGKAEAGMGIALDDFDGDGRFDIVVTNYEGETHALYGNRGAGLFTDRRFVANLAEPTLLKLAFGVASGDLDHDGDPDLAVANGHVRDNAEMFNPASSYRQANQIFENLGGGRFAEAADAGLDAVRASRGLALGDLDGDGDLDLVIGNVDDEAEVYENRLPAEAGGWLIVELDLARGNRQGVGARVAVEAGGRRQLREVRTGCSFQSHGALGAHFGVGHAARIDRLTVRLASGRHLAFVDLPARRRVMIAGQGRSRSRPRPRRASSTPVG